MIIIWIIIMMITLKTLFFVDNNFNKYPDDCSQGLAFEAEEVRRCLQVNMMQ